MKIITIFAAMTDFFLDLEANGDKTRTLDWYQVQLIPFMSKYSAETITEFNHSMIRDYVLTIQRSDQSPFTKRAKINALLKFWSWAAARYQIPNPAAAIKRPANPEPKIRAIDGADLLAMFKASYNVAGSLAVRDRAILILMADTGIRSAGLLGLRLVDLDIGGRRMLVTEKLGRTRSVPFTALTQRLLLDWLARRPAAGDRVFCTVGGRLLTHAGLRQIFRRLARRAGVKGCANPHSLRHFAAREYLKQGGDLASAAQILGHSNVSTTARYYARFDNSELGHSHDLHSPLKSLFKSTI